MITTIMDMMTNFIHTVKTSAKIRYNNITGLGGYITTNLDPDDILGKRLLSHSITMDRLNLTEVSMTFVRTPVPIFYKEDGTFDSIDAGISTYEVVLTNTYAFDKPPYDIIVELLESNNLTLLDNYVIPIEFKDFEGSYYELIETDEYKLYTAIKSL